MLSTLQHLSFSMRGSAAEKETSMAGRKPELEAFVVTEGKRDGDNGYWTKIGAAWKSNDGKGYTLEIIAGTSVSGRVVLRPPKPPGEKKTSEKRSAR